MRYRARPEEAENPFWITYSDLLSSMVLLLLILLVVFIKISEAQRIELENSQKKLLAQVAENDKNEPFLKQLSQQKIAQRTKSLAKLRRELKKLKEDLKRQKVEIGLDEDNLTLSVSEKLLFEIGKDKLLPKGKKFLSDFIPALARTITNTDDYVNFSNIDQGLVTGIVFDGQADPTYNDPDWDKAYVGNLDITLKRSENVVAYIFSKEFTATVGDNNHWTKQSKERLRYLVVSSGRSSMDRIQMLVGNPDRVREEWRRQELWKTNLPGNAASRQVVIQLKLYNPLQHFDMVEGSK